MRKVLLVVGFLLWWASGAFAATISLSCSPVLGATSYVFYQSTDLGTTWTKLTEQPTCQWTGTVAEDTLLLFKVSGKTATAETFTNDRGAWYSYKLSLNPGNLSVK